MRTNFEIEIFKSRLTYRQIDEEMNWAPGKTSATVSGAYSPTKEEREYLGAVLGVSPCDIFPEEALTFSEQYSPSPEAA